MVGDQGVSDERVVVKLIRRKLHDRLMHPVLHTQSPGDCVSKALHQPFEQTDVETLPRGVARHDDFGAWPVSGSGAASHQQSSNPRTRSTKIEPFHSACGVEGQERNRERKGIDFALRSAESGRPSFRAKEIQNMSKNRKMTRRELLRGAVGATEISY